MAMNEVNPLSFIRRVIPDTAATTNAETFKQKAALGLQNNKQAAAMAQALREISGREKVSRLTNSIPLSASGEGLDTLLQRRSDVNQGKSIAQTLASMREGNVQTRLPSGATPAQMANPNNPVNHILDKGVLQSFQDGKNTLEEISKRSRSSTGTVRTPDGWRKVTDTNEDTSKDKKQRSTRSNALPSAEPANIQVQQQPAAPTGVPLPAQVFDEQLENGRVQFA